MANTETKQARENRLRPKLLKVVSTDAPDTEWMIGDVREVWTLGGFECRFSYRVIRQWALRYLQEYEALAA